MKTLLAPLSISLLSLSFLAGCDSDDQQADAPIDEQAGEEREQSDGLSWSTHIRPLIAERCGSCHVEGGAAPFALDSYEALESYGELALNSIESGRMPPWQPADDCNPIQNKRSMPEEERELFKAWWNGDRLKGADVMSGELSDLGSVERDFTPTHRASVPSAYTPTLGESDDYRCFILDMEIDQTSYLIGSDVSPGNSLVHHVLVYSLTGDQADEALRLDEAEEGPGYTCFGSPIPLTGITGGLGMNLGSALAKLSFPNQIGSWVPGSQPALLEAGTGLKIDAGSKVVMQVHYSAVAGEVMADDSTEYQASLTNEPPETLIKSRPFAQRSLEIPAGASEVIASITIPYYNDTPSTVIGMAGHMHLLGKSVKAELERTDGTKQCGLDIPHWDFSWQEAYTFEAGHELVIESGDRLKLTCSYDNSSLNQPVINGVQQEPRDVAWGDGTLDEMCLLYTRTREPFSEPISSEALCSSACIESCQEDLACLTRCESDNMRCVGCMLETTLACEGGNQCLGGLITARECLSTCISSALMLGGNFGACLEAECDEAWSMASTCFSERAASESCRPELTACGF